MRARHRADNEFVSLSHPALKQQPSGCTVIFSMLSFKVYLGLGALE